MSEFEVTEGILKICRRLNDKNMLAAADGNVSYRLDDQHILITPTGLNKAFIRAEDMTMVTLDNQIVKGRPSGERLMHLAVYKLCPQARCVVHAHPPTAVAWSVARPDLRELPSEALPEVILAVGAIPVVPYARPTTEDMGKNLKPYLPKHRVMILSRHGALSWGEDLLEAYNGMERLEHSAQILQIAQVIGGLSSISHTELRALKGMRQKFGDRNL